MHWTEEQIHKRLLEIQAKGFLPIPDGMYRKDEGVIGQILEREFGIKENNISVRDHQSPNMAEIIISSLTLRVLNLCVIAYGQ